MTPVDPSQYIYTYNPTTNDMYDDYDYYHYMYIGYAFERSVYLYVWEILVIWTTLVNIIVVWILLRKNMRGPINVVLTAIAISDSLTGLSTLPSYIITYNNYEPPWVPPMISHPTSRMEDITQMHSDEIFNDTKGIVQNINYFPNATHGWNDYNNNSEGYEAFEGYKLTKQLCRWFMISKFFLSKSFHSISIYLTLFLGIQRFISVAIPFKARLITTERAILICQIIFLLSPILHIYHLLDEKAKSGNCSWDLEEDGCAKGCVVLWIMFFLRNLIPCCVLLVFTIMFILELRKGEETLRKLNIAEGQIAKRVMENRRIAIIVTAIVVVFLIPEIPYGFYLLYNAINKTLNNGENLDLEINRAVHMIYELLIVLSFHSKFYIYTVFNRKFRICFIKIFTQPVRRLMGDIRRTTVTTTSRNPKSDVHVF